MNLNPTCVSFLQVNIYDHPFFFFFFLHTSHYSPFIHQIIPSTCKNTQSKIVLMKLNLQNNFFRLANEPRF